jgi:hypothetical protein
VRSVVYTLLLVTSCYEPPRPICGFLCGPQGACPAGYACNATDGFCHREGTNVSCPLIDAGVDAFDFFPRIAEVAPADMATEVGLDVTPTVKFTEQVEGVSATSFTLTPRDRGEPVPAVVTYDAATRTASLDPDDLLEASIVYEVALGADIVDRTGKPLTGQLTWSFRTMADLTPPMVTMTSPANGATGVPPDVVLVASFSERVASVTPSTFLLEDATGAPVAGTVGFVSLTQESFTPSVVLAPSTVYTATLTSGVVDLKGNPLANAPVTWTFTTGADTTAPTVVMRSPDVDATGVPLDATVFVQFSEAVIGVSITSVTLADAGGAVAGTTSQIDPRFARFVPDAPLAPNTTYTATLSTAISDPSGNVLAGAPVSWTFATGR